MAKRTFDVIVGSVLAILAIPFIAVAAIGVMVVMRVPPFFSQERIGRDGKRFRFIKIRTLPTSFPRDADKYAVRDLTLPRFVAALRRLHVDELPQLFLVPLGTMSLVGPRPEMPRLHDQLPTAFARNRVSVRPGCTGLWQVGVGAGGLIGESPSYDQFYVEHQSLRLDLWILARTVALLVTRRRVVGEDEFLASFATSTPAIATSPERAAPRVGVLESS